MGNLLLGRNPLLTAQNLFNLAGSIHIHDYITSTLIDIAFWTVVNATWQYHP
ncbi:hypothetical protein BH10CHL1_BH10CHL1_45200 [soil metagenome]